METQVLDGEIEANRRLSELGLTQEMLQQAVHHGQAAYANCTPNHPNFFPGLAAYAEATAALRDILLPQGWTREDDGNFALTVSPNGLIAIGVATGDEATGWREQNPTTKSSKGPRTSDAVQLNAALQYHLFPDHEKAADPGRTTWILLFCRDHVANEIRCELSRPTKMEEDGHISEWAERIILGSLPMGGDTLDVSGESGGGPQTDKIEIQIKRRNA